MTDLDWTRLTPHLERLFALTGEERDAYIAETCADDEALRDQLEHLVALDRDRPSFLRPPTRLAAGELLPEGTARLLEQLAVRGTSGRYELKGEVARGGMGVVMKVWDGDLRRDLAMKVTLDGAREEEADAPPSATDATILGRFLEEAQVTGQLDHPGVLPVHELGVDSNGHVYFTMPLVKGKTLSEVFDLAKSGEDGWTMARVLGVVLKVCDAMAYAHSKGVIHRDLKPANIMVGKFGETYVMDWGVAKVLGGEDRHDLRLRSESTTASLETERSDDREQGADTPLMTMDGMVVGTPAYMSPEQARGKQDEIDTRTDVYAIGAMLYHLMSGRMPYLPDGVSPGAHAIWRWVIEGPPRPLFELNPGAAPELDAICTKAMAREREERYADVGELAEDLRAYIEGRVVSAHETGAWAEARKWIQRNRPLAAALATIAFLLVVGLGVSIGLNEAKASALTRSRMQVLISSSRSFENESPQLALHLAREAAEIARSPEAATQLHNAIVSSPQIASTWIAEDPDGMAHRYGYAVTVAPDGSWFAMAGHADGGEEQIKVWNRSGEELYDLRGHPALVERIVASPDGKYLASVARKGRARIWKLGTPEPIVLGEKGKRGWRVWFSPDGSLLLAIEQNGIARTWDMTGNEVASFEGHTGDISCAGFSPDGKQVVTASRDATARIWNLDGTEQSVLEGHDGRVLHASFSPDGARVLTVDAGGTARIWSRSGREQASWQIEREKGGKLLIAWLPENEVLISWGGPDIELFDIQGELSRRFHLGGTRAESLATGSRGRVLAAGCEDETILTWSLDTGLRRVHHGHDHRVNGVHFDRDETSLASVSVDGNARFWDLASGGIGECGTGTYAQFVFDDQAVLVEAPRRLELRGLDGRLLQSFPGRWRECGVTDGRIHAVDRDDVVRVWNRDGELLANVDLGHLKRDHRTEGSRFHTPINIDRLALSPDGVHFATGHTGYMLRVWRLDGSLVFEKSVRSSDVPADFMGIFESLTFLRDGETVAAGTSATLLDLEGNVVGNWKGHRHWQISPEGDRVITIGPGDWTTRTSGDHSHSYVESFHLIDLDGRIVGSSVDHAEHVSYEEFSSGGRYIVSSSLGGDAFVWDTATDTVTQLDEISTPLSDAVLTESTGELITVSMDATVARWSLDGELLSQMRLEIPGVSWFKESVQAGAGTTRTIGTLSLSNDGRRLLSISAEGQVRVWATSWDELLTLADQRSRTQLSEPARQELAELLDG